MRNYILKYKYENLVHILLLALNAAIFVSASITLALMTNQLVSKRIQSFFSFIRFRGRALRYLFSFKLYYCCKSNKTNPENDFVYSSVLS